MSSGSCCELDLCGAGSGVNRGERAPSTTRAPRFGNLRMQFIRMPCVPRYQHVFGRENLPGGGSSWQDRCGI